MEESARSAGGNLYTLWSKQHSCDHADSYVLRQGANFSAGWKDKATINTNDHYN